MDIHLAFALVEYYHSSLDISDKGDNLDRMKELMALTA